MTDEKRYEIICPVCKKHLWACKSIFHDMGLNEHGAGRCSGCKSFLNLSFNPENETMKAVLYEDYLKNKGLEVN